MAQDYEFETGSSWADRMEKEEVSVDGNIKTVVKHEVGDNGRMKKITKVYEIKNVPAGVVQRRGWKKFGDATDKDNSSATQVSDEIFLTLTMNKEQLEQQDDDPLKKLGTHQKMVSCRYCKGDHWSTKCPYKDTLGATVLKLDEIDPGPSNVPSTSAEVGSGGGGSKYVPPGLRGEGKKGDSMAYQRQHDDQAAVRVTNLSEDADENDIRELFKSFGTIKRVFLAKDRKTQQSKGFAFVHFEHPSEARKAISNLNGYGYDHLILKVEWAKPSVPR